MNFINFVILLIFKIIWIIFVKIVVVNKYWSLWLVISDIIMIVIELVVVEIMSGLLLKIEIIMVI